jgi:hypothetical protein
MDLQEMGCVVVHWIEPAQDRESWLALVNSLKIFGFNKMRGISSPARKFAPWSN